MKLTDVFEKVFIIIKDRESKRQKQLEQTLLKLDIVDSKKIEWRRAIDGKHCSPPAYFQAGRKAWGNLQSHLRVVQDASMDQLESILVLEDNSIFHAQTQSLLDQFMREIPDDWEQLYLGGQHARKPQTVDYRPLVQRCRTVHHTHAYGLQAKAFVPFQRHITQAPDYIVAEKWDMGQQLGEAHHKELWKTYAPSWWLVGQKDESNGNTESSLTTFWWHWHEYANQLPIILLPNDIRPSELKPYAAYIYRENTTMHGQISNRDTLKKHLLHISEMAIARGTLPCFYFPGISKAQLEEVWHSGVLHFRDFDIEQLSDYPFNGIFPHPTNNYCKQSFETFRL